MSVALQELEAKLIADIARLNTLKCENSLAEFTKQAWHIIEPGTSLMWNWHLDTLCAYLEGTMNPQIHITRLIINIPPGSLKSILVSVMYPAWMWIKNPEKRILGVSNSQDLAIRDSRRTKLIITNDWYTDQWPMALSADQAAKTNYENINGGFRQSLGITANITGKRGDVIIMDDPHDASTAQSELIRKSVLEIYDTKLSTRVNSQQHSIIILVMQRLHHQDLTGHLLAKKRTKWIHVVMPMHYDSSFTYDAGLNLGLPEFDDPRSKDVLLFPDLFPEDVVVKLEEDMGEYACTPGETPILMADLSTKPIRDVKIGEVIMGYNNEINKDWYKSKNKHKPKISCEMFVPAKVTEVFKYEDRDVLEYIMEDGSTIRCTRDHKWYRPNSRGLSHYGAINLRNIEGKTRKAVQGERKPGTLIPNLAKINLKPDQTKFDQIKTYPIIQAYNPVTNNQPLHYKHIGRQTVYALTTETGNYIAWGHISSNSAGQLEQRPSPKGGGILRQHWFRILDKTAELPVCTHIFISCDTAYSEKDMINNSFSAFTTWGVFWNKAQQRDCILLLDVWFGQVDYPELRRFAHKIDKDKKPDVWLIEKKASGQCYDDKTEVLTNSGWKLFKDINIDKDKFAARNMLTKEFEWQTASAEIHENYSGDMYHFTGKTHDVMVTPEHRMLVNTLPASLGGHPSIRAKEKDCIITAKQLADHGGEKTKTPLTSIWNGVFIPTKSLSDKCFIPGLAGYPAKSLIVSGDTYIKFMAIYLSEGWTQHNSKNRYYGVHIGQYETNKSYNLYYDVIKEVNQGKKPKTRRGKEIYITNKHLYGFVRQFGTYCDNKFIPHDIMNATTTQLQLFWDYYLMGDGHRTKHGHEAITTTSKKMADQLQELAQKIGYSASIRLASVPKKPFRIGNNKKVTQPKNLKPCYVVRLRTSKAQKLNANKTIYTGKIHCVQVPNGIVYVRRNGFPTWCGNSLVQDLRQSGLLVRTYVPTTDKVSRAYAVQPMLESGQVWIPDRKWAHTFAYKMGTFPTGDPCSFDLADTCTQALLYIRNGLYVTHPDDEDYAQPEIRRTSAYGGHTAEIDQDVLPALPTKKEDMWNN